MEALGSGSTAGEQHTNNSNRSSPVSMIVDAKHDDRINEVDDDDDDDDVVPITQIANTSAVTGNIVHWSQRQMNLMN